MKEPTRRGIRVGGDAQELEASIRVTLRQEPDQLSGFLRNLEIGLLFHFAALLAAMQPEQRGQGPALVEQRHLDGEDDPDMARVEDGPPSRR
jgi:hypothetical protein